MNFKYYADLYLKFGRDHWKVSTYDKNSGIVKNRLSYFFDYEINDIKPSDIRIWLSLISDVGNKSKKHYLSSLNQILSLALQDEIIDKNPVNYIKALKIHSPSIEPFTDEEVNLILNEARFYPSGFRLFLAIGFFTGMRTGEILALKYKDVDLDKRTISIKSTRSRFGESSPKTLGGIRIIPIVDALYSLLLDYARFKRDYVLTTYSGKPYRDTNVFTDYWKQILKTLNLKYRRLYTMRHTYATNMLSKNLVTPLELASLLGHTSPKMIYDVYVKYVNRDLNRFDRSIKIY